MTGQSKLTKKSINMRNHTTHSRASFLSMMASKLGMFVVAAVGLVCVHTQAFASVIPLEVAGSTLGAFNADALAASDSFSSLTYNDSTFDGTSSSFDGLLAFGSTPASPNVQNLGSFTLSSAIAPDLTSSFTLQVTFTAPAGIDSGNNPALFSATVHGSVSGLASGGAVILFDSAPRTFTFNDGTNSGSFTFAVDPKITVLPGESRAIGAEIHATVQPIPEMATMLPLGAILAAAGI
ncbi:MAG: hypothetical protein M3O82_09745, partial [Verrucomicrobiota bacterium]|nr:hypothetical protein [Verrucomicrobiota bacterium]